MGNPGQQSTWEGVWELRNSSSPGIGWESSHQPSQIQNEHLNNSGLLHTHGPSLSAINTVYGCGSRKQEGATET